MLHCCRDLFLGKKATEVHRGHTSNKIRVLDMMMMTMTMMDDDDDDDDDDDIDNDGN